MITSTGRALLDAEKILREAGLSEGQTYVDFGCGSLGHFVIPAASLVGVKGQVYAFDILPDVLIAINERSRAEKIFPLETVWGDLEHLKGTDKISADSVDLASLVNITGLLLKNQQAVNNIKRVLKPNGRLLLVDWLPNSSLAGFMSIHPTDSTKLKEILEVQGFRLLKSFKASRNHFGLLFENLK